MNEPLYNNCFLRFNEKVDGYELPARFNYPFNYNPHPLCRLAAKELQEYLARQTDWVHEFGIDQRVEGTNIGKMFGVMVVLDHHGELGYLAAFSGKVGGSNHHPRFVPPIVDLLDENGFYRKGENDINAINERIRALEASDGYTLARKACAADKQQADAELEQYRRHMKAAKLLRDQQRQTAQPQLLPDAFEALKEQLKNESLKWQYDYKMLVKDWNGRLADSQRQLDEYDRELSRLKEQRKTMSAGLQQRMFDQYAFLNAHGQTRNVCDIFAQTVQKVPPAGAGDCAGPKMLQFAYQHNLKPLAMAEFWWGQSPKSEVRKHGFFYPSCNSKCKPILGHMLQGIGVDPDPVLAPHALGNKPVVVFVDDAIIIVNKPAEYLSVPGKTEAESVYSFIRQLCPRAEGPLMVHRLDMSTSGLMVIAKTWEAYHNLQNQFLHHTVKKQYMALLEGIVAGNEGTIDLPLRADIDDRPRQLVCPDYGKPAITRWSVLDRANRRTRILFVPVTGRTHQLRVHSAHPQGLNCPIVGDDLYGQRADRLHLHAAQLEFAHPVSNAPMFFRAEPEF